MHSALMIVEKPDLSVPTEQPRGRSWSKLLSDLHALAENNKGVIEQLGEGCAQIALEKGANVLADALHAASESALAYRVLFFEKPPQWIIGSGR